MPEMTGNQMFAALVTMRDSSGEAHYERIKLADKLLKDHDWVNDPAGGGGDEDKAITRLEEECFGDLCGAVELVQLLDIYHNVPNIEKWRKHKFNLKKIWADWQEKTNPEPRQRRRAATAKVMRQYVSPSDFADLAPGAARREYDRVFRAVESDTDKITRLQNENEELREENKRLKEEVKSLKERILTAVRGAV